MADFAIKRNDTQPVLTDTLTYSDGSAANLTGGSVKFVMRALTAASPAINTTATITNAATGAVAYTFLAADTAAAGTFLGEWHVTFAGGALMTFPTDGYLEISVEEDLVTAGGARLVSLFEVKDHLRIPATDRSHDARLMRLIDGITPVVENITGPIVQKTYTETYDGGTAFISLRHRPVISVTSVVEYRGGIAYTLTQVATPDLGSIYSFAFQTPGRIVRRTVGGGVTAFPAGPDAVAVVYVAGYATVPHNVREGALELLRVNYQQTEQGGRPQWGTDESVEPIAGPMLGFFIPNRVRELLSPSKRHPSVA